MEPIEGGPATRTKPDGRFTVPLSARRHTVMAMDRERKRGGIVILSKGHETDPIEIKLGPLVKVKGLIRGPSKGQIPTWTHMYVHVPWDETRPIDNVRLASCGSDDARFEFSLPPGHYTLIAYNQGNDAYTPQLLEIDLRPGERERDLGTVMLSDSVIHDTVRVERAKAAGTWGDFNSLFGKPAPEWHITDATGIPKDAKIQDFKGKWTLIYFWGFGCSPCLGTGLPKMIQFYEDHAADRDRFQIISFCIEADGEFKNIADLDRKLEPIIKHVWKGKRLPFPSVLDGSFETMERFGLPIFGPVLIDPEGRMIKGDETVLEAELRKPNRSSN